MTAYILHHYEYYEWSGVSLDKEKAYKRACEVAFDQLNLDDLCAEDKVIFNLAKTHYDNKEYFKSYEYLYDCWPSRACPEIIEMELIE